MIFSRQLRKIKYKLLPYIIYLVFRFLHWSFRYQIVGQENLDVAGKMGEGSYLLALWHQNVILGILAKWGKNHLAISSRSADGDLTAKNLQWMGHQVIRGSSHRGGAQASLQIIREIRKNRRPCAITVDGPKGPAKISKPGVFHLASTLQIPIIPYTVVPTSFLVVSKSWDKMIVPLPFSKVYVIHGSPINIPKNFSAPELEVFQQQLFVVLEEQQKKFIRDK